MQAKDEEMCFHEVDADESYEPPAKKYSIHPDDVINSFGTHTNHDPDVELMSEPLIKALTHQFTLNDEPVLSCERSPANLVHQSIADENAIHNQEQKCTERAISVPSTEKKPNWNDQLEYSTSLKDNVSMHSTNDNLPEKIKYTPSTFLLKESESEACNKPVIDAGTFCESVPAFTDFHVEQTLTTDEDKWEVKAACSSSIQKVPFKDNSCCLEEKNKVLLYYENFRCKESSQSRNIFDAVLGKMSCAVKQMSPSADCFFANNANSIIKPLDVLISQTFVHPPADVVNKILWTLVEEEQERLTKHSTLWYLTRLLNAYPPNRSSHNFYYKILFEGKRFMWDEITEIIQSSLDAFGVYDDKHSDWEGSCGILKILVNILTKDFETSKLKDFLNVGVIKKQAFSNVLFFIPENLAQRKLQDLLRFINNLVKPSLGQKQANLLEILMCLLHLMAETARLRYTCHEARALSCSQLNSFTAEIFVYCRDIEEDAERTKIFLDMLSPLWLKIKVAESLLTKVIPQIPFYCSQHPTTLRKIVRQYIFPPSEQLILAKKKVLSSEASNNENSSMCASRIMKRNPKGETQIHVKCRQNKSEELKEILAVPGIDINVQDYAGWTPLHECCDNNSYDCAKLLVTWFPSDEKHVSIFPDHMTAVDLFASCNGITPLHEAVKKCGKDIVELLLEYGGPLLVNLTDNEGKTPQDLAIDSPHLKDILETAQKNIKWQKKNRFDDKNFNFDADLSYSKRIFPKMSSADYSYYAYLLGILLDTYLCFTKLLFLQNSMQENYSACGLKSHVERFLIKSGCTPNNSDIVNRLDDLFVLKRLREVLKTLVSQIKASGITNETQELFITLELMLC